MLTRLPFLFPLTTIHWQRRVSAEVTAICTHSIWIGMLRLYVNSNLLLNNHQLLKGSFQYTAVQLWTTLHAKFGKLSRAFTDQLHNVSLQEHRSYQRAYAALCEKSSRMSGWAIGGQLLASAGLWLELANRAESNSRQVILHDVISRHFASSKTNWQNLIVPFCQKLDDQDQHTRIRSSRKYEGSRGQHRSWSFNRPLLTD